MRLLRLKKETLRELEVDDLRSVIGADPTPTHRCTIYPTIKDPFGCVTIDPPTGPITTRAGD